MTDQGQQEAPWRRALDWSRETGDYGETTILRACYGGRAESAYLIVMWTRFP